MNKAEEVEKDLIDTMLEKGRSRKFNHKAIIESSQKMYPSDEETPCVIIAPSLLGAQVMANTYPLLMLGLEIETLTGADLDDCFDSLDDDIAASKHPGYANFPTKQRVHKALKLAWKQLKEQYRAWPKEKPRLTASQVIEEVKNEWPSAKSLMNSVYEGANLVEVIEGFNDFLVKVLDKLPSFYQHQNFSKVGNFFDIKWLAPLLAKQPEIQNLDETISLLSLLKEGVYTGIQLKGIYFVVLMPPRLVLSGTDIYTHDAYWEDMTFTTTTGEKNNE